MNSWAAFFTEAKFDKSRLRKIASLPVISLSSAMAASALDLDLDAKYTFALRSRRVYDERGSETERKIRGGLAWDTHLDGFVAYTLVSA